MRTFSGPQAELALLNRKLVGTKSSSGIRAASSTWATPPTPKTTHASGVRTSPRCRPSPHPCFVDWTIRDLATYDFPALINHVSRATGHPKIAFIGHSQGTALAFLALALRPALGTQLSCFIALAPAVFAGPLTARFPLNLLSHLGWERWQACFGVRDFIPAMRLASAWRWVPPRVFAAVGYGVFACLFGWTDRHW